MKNDEFILTQGLGQQLEFAFRRNNWDAAQVHRLCQGDILGRVRHHMLQPDEPHSLANTLERNPIFIPWKTITIGKRRSVDELLQALADDNYPVWPEAEAMLRHPDVVLATQETEIRIARLTISDFGLEDYLHFSIMRRRMKKMGFELCTAEMAAELRLVCDDQEDIATMIAMKPINDMVLSLRLDDEKGELELSCQEVVELNNYTPGFLEYICVIP